MKKRFSLSNTQLILVSFLGAILVGSLLLTLPVSRADGSWLSFTDAVFTATTSVCVTGLVTVPITSFSLFGQVVILLLVQIGGLGVVTVFAAFTIAFHKKMGVGDRLLLQDAFNLNDMNGVVSFIRRAVFGTLAVEGAGALGYMIAFVPRFGWRGVWLGVFHAVSAFCNAGLDILGENSLCDYALDPVVCGVTMLLIILGGLGFVVWWDLVRVTRAKKGWRGLTLHSKIALSTTVLLILLGTLGILLFEFDNPDTMGSLPWVHKLRLSLFQSVTTRTAGFATVPQENLTGGSVLVSLFLMFVGGSPVGTAGGIKTVTLAVLLAFAAATVRDRREVSLFHRRIPRQALNKAVAVGFISLGTALVSALFLCLSLGGDALNLVYEAVSATATVGLTRGVTGALNGGARWVVIATMYLGRVGPISLAVAFSMKRDNQNLILDPLEEISVG